MARALSVLKPEWYTLPDEEGEEHPTQFLIRPLSGPERADVELFRDKDGIYRFTGEGTRALLRFGLLDWKNFADEEGEVRFVRGDPVANLARLDLGTAAMLAVEIWKRSALTEEQRKNLQSPPT